MTYDGFLRLLPVYGFTIFLNAALLFWVEPLISRMVLPILGGRPAIWNTCMVFFQAMVLLGCLVLLERLFHRRLAQLAVLLMAVALMRPDRDAIFHERTFFGVHEVQASLSASGQIHYLFHGTTIHGMQFREPELRRESFGYFSPDGPYGQVFSAFQGARRKRNMAVAGLGAGTLACFGEAGQRMTFYEIDPVVARMATNPNLFTLLADSQTQVDIVLGDARLRLQQAPQKTYGVLALDAFSSDLIPSHLMTREALQIYLRALEDDGILVFHITNRHFTLAPVLAALAQDAGLVARWRNDSGDWETRRWATILVVLARRLEDLGPLSQDPQWQPLPAQPGSAVWTDDYANVIGALKSGSSQ